MDGSGGGGRESKYSLYWAWGGGFLLQTFTFFDDDWLIVHQWAAAKSWLHLDAGSDELQTLTHYVCVD